MRFFAGSYDQGKPFGHDSTRNDIERRRVHEIHIVDREQTAATVDRSEPRIEKFRDFLGCATLSRNDRIELWSIEVHAARHRQARRVLQQGGLTEQD